MAIIVIFPTFVLLVGTLLLCMFRSKKGFKVDLWKFWRNTEKRGITEKTHKVIKHKHLQERVDERKTEEYLEEQENNA